MARTKKLDQQVAHTVVSFNAHPGGQSKEMYALDAGIPIEEINGVMVEMGKRSVSLGALAICQKIGGQWIYGFVHLISEHLGEHFRRRILMANSQLISIAKAEQTVAEFPNDLTAQGNLDSHRFMFNENRRQLRLLQSELASLKVAVRIPQRILNAP